MRTGTMAETNSESCGRCSMTSIVDMSEDEEHSDRDPFGDARIMVSEDDLRTAAKPQILFGRIKRRLDEIATRLTYGR